MNESMKRHIKLILQYEGTNYAGWQRQPAAITIQSILEDALERLTGEKTKVIAAGRTDSGVHAIGQVASFRTSSGHSPEVFLRALNSMLPPDVRVLSVEEAEDDFHPRYSARAKRYIYLVDLSPVQSPFLRRYAYHLPLKLDLEAMKEAAMYCLGRRDFRAFQASGCGSRTTIREVYKLDIEQQEEIDLLGFHIEASILRFTVEANAFLRYMVRTMVGTLLEVGRGKLTPYSVQQIIESRDRTLAGPTAPPHGLFLERVFY